MSISSIINKSKTTKYIDLFLYPSSKKLLRRSLLDGSSISMSLLTSWVWMLKENFCNRVIELRTSSCRGGGTLSNQVRLKPNEPKRSATYDHYAAPGICSGLPRCPKSGVGNFSKIIKIIDQKNKIFQYLEVISSRVPRSGYRATNK
jgi:hypothetical protein